MVIQCVCNDGFEDVLSIGEFYQAEQGVNGYMILNDRAKWAWYGQSKFKIIIGETT